MLTFATAALAGAAVFAQPAKASARCATYDHAAVPELVERTRLIVIGEVHRISETEARLEPEAYLKGPADGSEIAFIKESEHPECPYAELEDGDRVLAMFRESGSGPLPWPEALNTWRLVDGEAVNGDTIVSTEPDLVAAIRGVTGQYAVPARSADEGAGIDWVGTVLPVGGALVGLMVVGLFLMRIWHRIDPS